jgi:hypothetical protein
MSCARVAGMRAAGGIGVKIRSETATLTKIIKRTGIIIDRSV